jgi:hypothetical protein
MKMKKENNWLRYSKAVEDALHLQFAKIIDKDEGNSYE